MNANGQNFFVLSIDSNAIKSKCGLIICMDDLNSGIVHKVTDCNLDSTFLEKSKIRPLKVNGLTKNILFFDFECINTYGSLKYTFGWNQESNTFYKIKGFYSNDYKDFFSYLKGKGMKLNKGYFEKEKVYIEGIDIICLLELYNTKAESKNNPVITEDDRRKFECLHYHSEPIITAFDISI